MSLKLSIPLNPLGIFPLSIQILLFIVLCNGLVQVETGNPYMLFKDSCNRKSNQQNLGTIKCSNLCTEIVEFTSPEETAVCNLASIALPRYVREREASPSTGRPKLTGSLNAPNRHVASPLQYISSISDVAAAFVCNLSSAHLLSGLLARLCFMSNFQAGISISKNSEKLRT